VPAGAVESLEGRGLKAKVTVPPSGLSHAEVAGLGALVCYQDPAKPTAILPTIETYAARVLDFGALVFVLTSSDGVDPVLRCLFDRKLPFYCVQEPPVASDGRGRTSGEPPFPHIRVYPAAYTAPEHYAAEILQYGPRFSPAWDDPAAFELKGDVTELCTKQRLILRRCFHDCSQLHLKKLPGGRSRAAVFRAHATIKTGTPTSPIFPFFVKLGPRSDVTMEWGNYGSSVTHRIPFYLAPRLDWGRCEVGASLGALVGDFVDYSESLSECATGARASSAIGSLFERTIREWRSRGEEAAGPLYAALRLWFKLDRMRMPQHRFKLAQSMGLKTKYPLDLPRKLLGSRPPDERWMQGTIHGDLHAENIQVRGADAILIDFRATREKGLMLADPAALETSLVFRAPGGPSFDSTAWSSEVGRLYEQPNLRAVPGVPDPREPYAWLGSCVRQIRLYALELERRPGQYASVLAYRMLHAACKTDDPGSRGQEWRRATAACLAEQLFTMIW